MNRCISAIYYLSEFNTASVVFRLFFATLMGGVIGLDRGLKKRPAGLRTFALVSVGAALAMITNEYLLYRYANIDISRMAAQVISGVGFLGAGTILVTGKQRVKGLTTAASLWATASMGVAIGAGFITGAFIGFLCIMSAMTILHSLDERMRENSRVIELYIEARVENTIPLLLDYIHKNGFAISSLEKSDNSLVENSVILLLELNLKKRITHSTVLEDIAVIDGIITVQEIK